MVNRVSRAGYACELRRLRDIPAGRARRAAPDVSAVARRRHRARVLDGAGAVRRPGRRRLRGGHRDARTAGCARCISFVPWGERGLSLDLMRRDHDSRPRRQRAAHRPRRCSAPRELGVERVSLNFAVFRSALARGERIGAGPGTRAWRRVLLFASRWAQIESLYRFNASSSRSGSRASSCTRTSATCRASPWRTWRPRRSSATRGSTFWRGRDRRAAGSLLSPRPDPRPADRVVARGSAGPAQRPSARQSAGRGGPRVTG